MADKNCGIPTSRDGLFIWVENVDNYEIFAVLRAIWAFGCILVVRIFLQNHSHNGIRHKFRCGDLAIIPRGG